MDTGSGLEVKTPGTPSWLSVMTLHASLLHSGLGGTPTHDPS